MFRVLVLRSSELTPLALSRKADSLLKEQFGRPRNEVDQAAIQQRMSDYQSTCFAFLAQEGGQSAVCFTEPDTCPFQPSATNHFPPPRQAVPIVCEASLHMYCMANGVHVPDATILCTPHSIVPAVIGSLGCISETSAS